MKVWRRMEHLRKGKRSLDCVARELIDWRLYSWRVEVCFREGGHYDHLLLIINSRHTKHSVRMAFDTYGLQLAMFNMAVPMREGIQRMLVEMDTLTRYAPEMDRLDGVC